MNFKTSRSSLFILGIILLSWQSKVHAQDFAFSMERLWETPAGLQIPESVIYDDSTGIVYVSNIVGSPTLKDGKGFISKLNTNGEILDLNWITGLDAPKGMAIYNGKLYVTNITEIVEIDIQNSLISNRYPVPGSVFLNDIAADEKGNIYFTDTKKGSVSILSNGKVNNWLDDKLFEGANGLYYKKGILYIGTNKGILKAFINTGDVMSYLGTNAGVDGLFVTSDNKFVYSDWTGSVYITKPGKKITLLINTTLLKENAADFCAVPSLQLIMVPTFSKNTVVGYRVNFLQ